MRVSIAKGEKLDINITEGDRIVGALSISLNSVDGSSRGPSAKNASGDEPKRRGRKPGSKSGPAKKPRNYTAESKEAIRAGQKRRWDAIRAAKAAAAQDNNPSAE
jgi:hypothetical protein